MMWNAPITPREHSKGKWFEPEHSPDQYKIKIKIINTIVEWDVIGCKSPGLLTNQAY